MAERKLREALAEVQEQLESTEQLSADERALLLETLDEIRDRLAAGLAEAEPGPAEGGSPTRPQGALSGRVADLLEDFETSHPKLAEILSNLSESLANMGI